MIDVHIQAEDPQQMVGYLVALASAVQGTLTEPQLAPREGLALYATEELMAEVAVRGQADPAQLPLFTIDQAPVPPAAADAAPKKRGRPAKQPTVPPPEQHPMTGELPPVAPPVQAELPDMGTGGVASTGPEKEEMERLITALYSRGQDATHLRDFMLKATGEPTLNKTPRDKWPLLKSAIEQELKTLDARVG